MISSLRRYNTMTPPQDDELAYAYSSGENRRWFRQWWEEGREYQSLLLFNKLDEPLKAGDPIVATSYLFADIRNRKLSRKDCKSRGIIIIDENLTEAECNQLSII